MIHVMVDLETLSTANNALILSIGAVKFDTDTIVDRFHVGIEPTSAQNYGLHIDAETVLWWMRPEHAEARQNLLDLPRKPIFSALSDFSNWVNETQGSVLGSIWGNGATFDNIVLRNAFQSVGLRYPVSYRQDSCYRTLRALYPEVRCEPVGVLHDALADAESQAVHLQAICKSLGVSL